MQGSRTRLGVWPPTACSDLQAGSFSSLLALLFSACFYELIIPLFLLQRLTLPFHPHALEAPDTSARLPRASRLPREMAHKEFVECPQETLPRSRPQSSFNTGRKIKKKKIYIAKSLATGGKLGASEPLISSLPGQASVRPCGLRPWQPMGTGCPEWGRLEEAETR